MDSDVEEIAGVADAAVDAAGVARKSLRSGYR